MTKRIAPNHIRWRKIDKAVVILDLRTEGYYVLDPIATAMWDGILSGVDVVMDLHQRFGGERERIQADFDAFVGRSILQGFLAVEETPARVVGSHRPRVSRKSFLMLRAWWSLFRTCRMLVRKGFRVTYESYAVIPKPEPTPDVGERLAEAIAAFAKAENFFHMKKAPQDCLPRSLALYRFLRSVGIPAEHCIGVRRFPFGAHAWVEHQGKVVHDHPAQPTVFAELARVIA